MKYKCFRCERSKPECKGARECSFDEKADGSAINALEVASGKFQHLKEEMRKRRNATKGTSHVIQGEVVPRWDELMMDEESHDGNVLHDWAFAQQGMIVDKVESDDESDDETMP